MSDEILLLSGDIELNPGPSTVKEINHVTFPAARILEMRLHPFGSRPMDIGGVRDCFLRAVLHQLYGNPSCRGFVRSQRWGTIFEREPKEIY